MQELTHYIGGEHVKGTSGRFADVMNPATGEVQAKVPLASADELDKAVQIAAEAQPAWAATNPQRRARVLMKFVDLLNRDMDKLAEALSREHGKTLPDAAGALGDDGDHLLEREPAGGLHLLQVVAVLALDDRLSDLDLQGGRREDVLLAGAPAAHPVHRHRSRLADAVAPVLGLQLVRRVPLRLADDDRVRPLQVQPQAPGPDADEVGEVL